MGTLLYILTIPNWIILTAAFLYFSLMITAGIVLARSSSPRRSTQPPRHRATLLPRQYNPKDDDTLIIKVKLPPTQPITLPPAPDTVPSGLPTGRNLE